MNRIDEIMDKIHRIVSARRDERENDGNSWKPCSKKFLDERLQLYKETFQALDAFSSGLRTIAPIDEEKSRTKRSLRLLKSYWLELKLAETPKWHTTLDHAIKDMY